MKILFLGDVVGRAGRNVVLNTLPRLREELSLDFIIVNAENATGGAGLTVPHAEALLKVADVLTLGDHAFDHKEMKSEIVSNARIIRPLNLGHPCPGVGARVYQDAKGRKILIAQILGQVFMKHPYANPFHAIDAALEKTPLGGAVQAIIVDFHAEATSEKMAMGHHLNGRASLLVGTHTHVPTGDARILSNGTGYMSDAGMCGDYNSVIGMDAEEPLHRFLTGLSKGRFKVAGGDASLSGVIIESDDTTGQCLTIMPMRLDGELQSTPL